MKRSLVTIIFVFCICTYTTKAQEQKKTAIDFTSLYKKEIQLDFDTSVQLLKIPFKGFEIQDKRNDTAILGFYKQKIHEKTVAAYLTFKNGSSREIEDYLKQAVFFDTSFAYELVLIIRKLWLSNEIKNERIYDDNKKMDKPYLPGAIARFEFYAKKNNEFIALYRYDTTLVNSKDIRRNSEELIKIILSSSLLALNRTDIQTKIRTGKYLSRSQVDGFSSSLKKFEPLHRTEFKKGVYLSFEEFKQNRPSISNYSVVSKNKTDLLLVKDETGSEVVIRKIWGFCDGENIYIKSANNFFPLFKKGDSFYSAAAKTLSKNDGTDAKIFMFFAAPLFMADGLNRSGALENYQLLLNYYQLDFETGELL